MQSIDFSEKSALIIDASNIVRSSTNKVLLELGFTKIKTSNTSSRALELVTAMHYDIVLVGHDDKERKTGLHILEEARYKNLIKSSTIWGFMTSNQSPDIILHATQSEPDFLISKPFSAAQLSAKLQASLRSKRAIMPINKALDTGNVKRALQYCDFALQKEISVEAVKKTKADILLQDGKFKQALFMLEEMSKKSPHQTIELKKCEALVGLKKYDQAMVNIDKLIKTHPLLIKAHDLKSKIYEIKGEIENSKGALTKAVRLSSMGIPRNLKLGKLSLASGDLAMAETIYKRTIQLNSGSCHQSPDPYLGLANTKREGLKKVNNSLEKEKEINAILKAAVSNFPDNPELKVKIALFRQQLQKDLNNPEKAAMYLQLAKKLVADNNIKEDIDSLMEGALAKIEVPKAVNENEAQKQQQIEMSNKINLQGIKQYLDGNIAKAIQYLTKSLELDKENGTTLLNLGQIYLESLHLEPDNQGKSLRLAKRYLNLAENLKKSAQQEKRYNELVGYLAGGVKTTPKGSLGLLLK